MVISKICRPTRRSSATFAASPLGRLPQRYAKPISLPPINWRQAQDWKAAGYEKSPCVFPGARARTPLGGQ